MQFVGDSRIAPSLVRVDRGTTRHRTCAGGATERSAQPTEAISVVVLNIPQHRFASSVVEWMHHYVTAHGIQTPVRKSFTDPIEAALAR